MKSASYTCSAFLLLCLTLGLTVILFGQKTLIEKLKSEAEQKEETISRISRSIQEEKKNVKETEESTNNIKKEVQGDTQTLNGLTAESEKRENEMKTCESLKNDLAKAVEEVQQQKTKLEEDFKVSKTEWSDEIAKLQQQLKEPSPVCAYALKEKDEEKRKKLEAAKLCPPTAPKDEPKKQ